MEFSLSHFNFKDIPFYKYAQDFTFIVNNKQYKTNRIVADILSPRIRKYHFNDESLNKYTFETHDHETMSDSTDYFSEFLQLVENHKIHLDEKHQLIFSEYFYQLGNYEEYINIFPSIPDPNRASENKSIQFLQQISKKNFFEETNLDNDKIKAHINNVSNNFLQINKKEFKKLDIEIIEEIIKQKTLQLDEEDSLLEIIIELYSEDRKYSTLFEFVEFRNVSETTLKKFIEVFEIDDLNNSIWASICSRLVPSLTEKKERDAKVNNNYDEFKYRQGEEFNGIIRFLTMKTGGNIHDNGTIEITSNSIDEQTYSPKNVVDYNDKYGYFSKDEDGSFLSFDFKNYEVQITNYSIKSYNQDKNYCHPKNWVIEVSKDGKTWMEIDRHENDSSLNDRLIVATFSVQKKQTEFYKFVRIRQTGNSWDERGNHFYFGICYIEFFGNIQPKVL